MQQNVSSSLTSATVSPELSIIDLWEARIDYLSRTMHQPDWFRHSIDSPSLFFVGSSQYVGATDNSDDVVTEENTAELPKLLKIPRLAIKEDLIRNFKENELSTYWISAP